LAWTRRRFSAKALLAVGVGLGDQVAVGGGLPPVNLQELGSGLEVPDIGTVCVGG